MVLLLLIFLGKKAEGVPQRQQKTTATNPSSLSTERHKNGMNDQ